MTVLAGFAVDPPAAGAVTWWALAGLAGLALLFDGVDGFVARRFGCCSAFGARFDMEFDAALIMALSVLVWVAAKAGSWVLAIGLMRYVFVAVGFAVPALTGALPESFRRKVVCVVQGVVLLVALGPIIPRPMAVGVAAAGLAMLTWSFAVDVVRLLRAGRTADATG